MRVFPSHFSVYPPDGDQENASGLRCHVFDLALALGNLSHKD